MWQQPVSIISYLLVAAVVVFVSIKLSDFVDLLDKKTKVSGAFLGGILLAAVTSLPELFTSLTATILVKDNSLVVGNILGSNLFNFALFAILFIFFFKHFVDAKVNKVHLLTMLFIALMYVCVTIGGYIFNYNHILWGWFNPMSIGILAIYAISVWKTPKEEESESKDEVESKLTVKQIIFWFVVLAIVLVGASIGITYLTDWVVQSFNIGSTFGGALFLGVATSLPEMTSTINLGKRKNYNAAFGNIVGSNCFNFIILSFADVFGFVVKNPDGSYHGLYNMDSSSFWLLVCGGFSFVIVLIAMIFKFKGKISDKPMSRTLFYVFGGLLILSYITFLVCSNINMPMFN